MKPAARIERECWIVNQLFEGYDGYVYEAANRWSGHVVHRFAFKGKRWPDNENEFEDVFDLNDGIYWLKNQGKNRPIWERYGQIDQKT